MATPDITVRGAGIFGLSVAWHCLLEGARVQVFDPHGVGAGASGGIVGALAPHVPENWNAKKAFQLDSLLAAQGFWAGVETASGQPTGYARTGRLQPVDDPATLALARARAESAASLWRGRATWTVEAVKGGDWMPRPGTGQVIRDDLTARIHPRRACESLAAAILARGGAIVEDGPEHGLVVHATGWEGLEALSRHRPRPVGSGIKGQAILLRHDAGTDAPQIFANGLHIVPHDDGTVAVGSTTERDWTDPSPVEQDTDALHSRASGVLPVLADARVVLRWAGIRPRARSRAPILGPWPGRRDHFVANGGFKIGFGMAPGVGRVMADLLLSGTDRIPDGFRVEDSL